MGWRVKTPCSKPTSSNPSSSVSLLYSSHFLKHRRPHSQPDTEMGLGAGTHYPAWALFQGGATCLFDRPGLRIPNFLSARGSGSWVGHPVLPQKCHHSLCCGQMKGRSPNDWVPLVCLNISSGCHPDSAPWLTSLAMADWAGANPWPKQG